MALTDVAVIAGSVSTFIFVGSYLPMLVKAARSKDLSSYSVLNLVLANVGNLVYSIYVFSLPAGPIWALHAFYVVGSALMLVWWAMYRKRSVAVPVHSSDQLPSIPPVGASLRSFGEADVAGTDLVLAASRN